MARIVKRPPQAEPDFLPSTRRIAGFAAERKARDVRAYDVRGLTIIADSFVLCTATSEPHAKAVFNAVKEGMKEIGVRPLCTEGKPADGWLVLDYGDVIFHIFREEARSFYDLDGLWGDAPSIDLDLDDAD